MAAGRHDTILILVVVVQFMLLIMINFLFCFILTLLMLFTQVFITMHSCLFLSAWHCTALHPVLQVCVQGRFRPGLRQRCGSVSENVPILPLHRFCSS